MKQIIAIIIVVVVSGIICTWAFIPVSKGLSKYYGNNYDHLNEILEKTTPYDLLFSGSSRTLYQIYPKIIDSICGMSSFNAAITGARIADFELILKGYLVNHPAPKVYILNIDLNSFSRSKEIRQYPEYYSFLNNKEVSNTLAKYGYHPELVKLFPFIAIMDLDDYNKENALRLLIGKGDIAMPGGDIADKGFVMIDSMTPYTPAAERLTIYDESLGALKEIIKLCKQKKIKVIFTYSPEFNLGYQKLIYNSDSILTMIGNIANQNNITYLRDDKLDICKEKDLFWNVNHLNKRGAMIYSAILAKEINTILALHTDSINHAY